MVAMSSLPMLTTVVVRVSELASERARADSCPRVGRSVGQSSNCLNASVVGRSLRWTGKRTKQRRINHGGEEKLGRGVRSSYRPCPEATDALKGESCVHFDNRGSDMLAPDRLVSAPGGLEFPTGLHNARRGWIGIVSGWQSRQSARDGLSRTHPL